MNPQSPQQQFHKSIQQIFSSTKRKPSQRDASDINQLELSSEKQAGPPLSYTHQLQGGDQTFKNFLSYNTTTTNIQHSTTQQDQRRINKTLKNEIFLSDESVSDYSPIMKPSLPSTPTNNVKASFSKNSQNFGNNNPFSNNSVISPLISSPQNSLLHNPVNTQTLQQEKKWSVIQDNQLKRVETTYKNEEKGKYYSHFRNYSTPDMQHTQQNFSNQSKEGQKELNTTISPKKQYLHRKVNSSYLLSRKKVEQNPNDSQKDTIQVDNNLSIPFTNPFIQSKVVTPQNELASNQKERQLFTPNGRMGFPMKSEKLFGIHLFHSRNQEQEMRNQSKKDMVKKLHQSILSLNDIQPNLFFNASLKQDMNTLAIIHNKEQQMTSLSVKDTIKQFKDKWPKMFQTTSTKNITQLKPNNLLTPQSSGKINQKKIYNKILSQTFSNNFQQYNVVDHGAQKRLIASIRQKQANTQSLDASLVVKNSAQQASFEDDFEEYIKKFEQKTDGIEENKNDGDAIETAENENLDNQNLKQLSSYPSSQKKIIIPILSSSKRYSLAPSQLDEKPNNENVFTGNINKRSMTASKQSEKRVIFSRVQTNSLPREHNSQQSSSIKKEKSDIQNLLHLENESQLNQLKMIQTSQQYNSQQGLISQKGRRLLNAKANLHQKSNYKNIKQVQYTNQNNPLYKLASQPSQHSQSQPNIILMKDVILDRLQSQQKKIYHQQQQQQLQAFSAHFMQRLKDNQNSQ